MSSASKIQKAIKALKSRRLTPVQRKFVEGVIRVDQAGELAADLIYQGQHMVFRQTRPELAPLIKHMWGQEIEHHNTFDALQTEGRVRPSLFTPLWKVAALTLGAGTAAWGKEAAMACTEAVETVIGGHYNEQLRVLYRDFPKEIEGLTELTELLAKFRDDELEHLDTAVANDAKGARPYWLLTETIKNGCRAAIWTAKHI